MRLNQPTASAALTGLLVWAVAASCQPSAPARGEDLHKLFRSKDYYDILTLGKTLSVEARADLVPLSQADDLTVRQKKALRMVVAKLGDEDAQKRTLSALCLSSMDPRYEVFQELRYIDGRFALQAIRTLLDFLDDMPWQQPEGDMVDSSFAFQSLKLLAALRPASPASDVHWLFASVRNRLPQYTQPSINWLEQSEKVSRLPSNMVPQCLQRKQQ